MGTLDSLKPTIRNVIAQFGTNVTLLFDNPGEFDEVAGKTTASETPVETKAVFDKVSYAEINQGIAESGDRKAYVASNASFPRDPRPSDRLEYGVDERGDPIYYRVTVVEPQLLTDEVGLFTLYVRR